MYFEYRSDKLFWHGINLQKTSEQVEQLLKDQFSYSGCYYLYNATVLKDRVNRLLRQLPQNRFFYSVKSLSNINILKLLRSYPKIGVDVVSSNEIRRALKAGFSAKEIVFAGVGKTIQEISFAIEQGIKSFHVESIAEIEQIEKVAANMNKQARVAIRLNPDIQVDTHKYITTGKSENKFGIMPREIDNVLNVINNSAHIELIGLQVHLGSLINEVEPFIKSLEFLVNRADSLKKEHDIGIEYLSLGGGLGIDYKSIESNEAAGIDLSLLNQKLQHINSSYQIDFEPGRYISAYAGLLMSHIIYIKEKPDFKIAITDAGMTELIRPALYEAHHPVLPVNKAEGSDLYDIVGPICETADFFRKKIKLNTLAAGDRMVVAHTGAYGSVMASNYNSRLMAPEVIIDNDNIQIIRKPQTFDQLIENELL